MNDEQEKIVLNNQKLIYVVLKKYHLYNEREDYYDLGMIGLVKGAKSFDKTKNIKLSTYLTKCISNEILMCLRKKRPEVVSFDNVMIDGEKLTYLDTIEDKKIDIENETTNTIDFENINIIISKLSKKEQFVINHIFNVNGYKKLSQSEISVILGVSQAQVSRIKDRAILNIRKEIKND